ncbi:brachyurin-like isoform X2 [Neocloeon triangulifer]|uniref:brachyurin-like isoform X2 n=1 Tax=Neocloeon triangulifer TaxID=2078957 RepID=UPI00286EF456|nr:brachyurin-like isoform X2 [Neocloeon triangulifer]
MNGFHWMFCTLWLLVSLICSSIAEKGNRIVGGDVATRGQFPWMAVITSEINGTVQLYCGGSMISGDYVITAAQCVPPENDLNAKIRVVLGVHNVSATTEIGRVDLIADYHFVHPNYSSDTFANDIAIVHLPTRVSSSPYVSQSQLPFESEINATYQGVRGRMSGWGSGVGTNYSDVLRYVDVDVQDLQVCIDNYGAQYVNEKHICLSTAGGRGPCGGDTGSPLTLTDTNSESHQIGIFSFYDEESCIRGKPVVFTKLASHWDFITDFTGIRPENPGF